MEEKKGGELLVRTVRSISEELVSMEVSSSILLSDSSSASIISEELVSMEVSILKALLTFIHV